MIGLSGLLLFGLSALWLMAAAMSDAPSTADDVAHMAILGVGAGLLLVVAQIVIWIARLFGKF